MFDGDADTLPGGQGLLLLLSRWVGQDCLFREFPTSRMVRCVCRFSDLNISSIRQTWHVSRLVCLFLAQVFGYDEVFDFRKVRCLDMFVLGAHVYGAVSI